MARFLKIYLSCFSFALIIGCKYDNTYEYDLSSSDQRNLKSQKSSKTDSFSIVDHFSKNKTNLRNKNLTARSTSNSANSISWDIDSDGIADALTDGLLLLRYNFGLTGESLMADVVSENSTLSTADIESAIAQVISISDIDADGNVDALTDSLILLRYLFGLTGET